MKGTKEIGVIGVGLMGLGIAYCCARKKLDVKVYDTSTDILDSINKYFERQLVKEGLGPRALTKTLENIHVV